MKQLTITIHASGAAFAGFDTFYGAHKPLADNGRAAPAAAKRFALAAAKFLIVFTAFVAPLGDRHTIGSDAGVLAEVGIGPDTRVLLAPVSVHGHALKFELDTGATRTTFDLSQQKLLGPELEKGQVITANGIERRARYAPPPMRLGNVDIPPAGPVYCQELGTVGTVNRDGVLGIDILKRLVIEIDFDKQRIRILSSADSSAGERIPIRGSLGGVPTVRARVGSGRLENFVIDTGAQGDGTGILAGSVFDHALAREEMRIIGEAKLSTRSRLTTTPIGRATRIALGGNVHEGPVFVRAPVELNVFGLDYLSRYVVTLDFPNDTLYLRPGREFYRRDSMDQSGLRLRRIAENTEVERVVEDGPAQRCGILPDDNLVAIDGEPVSKLSVREIERRFQAEGKSFRLSLRRAGALLEVTMRTGTERPRIATKPSHDADRKANVQIAQPGISSK